MRAIRIPENYVNGIGKVLALNPSQISEIEQAIKAIEEPTLDYPSFSDALVGLDEELIETIYSLIDLLIGTNGKVAFDKLPSLLLDSYLEQTDKSERTMSDVQNGVSNLSRIIEALNEKYRYVLKALELNSQTERPLISGRILTDIRYLFGEDASASGEAVILHRLKMTYSKDNEQKSEFFTLDATDIERLLEVLNRALQKEASIKEKYQEVSFIKI